MIPLMGNTDWARELCKALDEEPKFVSSIVIAVPADGIVIAHVKKFVDAEKGAEILTLIKTASWEEVETPVGVAVAVDISEEPDDADEN